MDVARSDLQNSCHFQVIGENLRVKKNFLEKKKQTYLYLSKNTH